MINDPNDPRLSRMISSVSSMQPQLPSKLAEEQGEFIPSVTFSYDKKKASGTPTASGSAWSSLHISSSHYGVTYDLNSECNNVVDSDGNVLFSLEEFISEKRAYINAKRVEDSTDIHEATIEVKHTPSSPHTLYRL